MKRYDIRIDCHDWDAYKLDITDETDGDWCKYSDVAVLVAKNERLKVLVKRNWEYSKEWRASFDMAQSACDKAEQENEALKKERDSYIAELEEQECSDTAILLAKVKELKAAARAMAKVVLWSNDPKKTITSHWNKCSCQACTIARKYQGETNEI